LINKDKPGRNSPDKEREMSDEETHQVDDQLKAAQDLIKTLQARVAGYEGSQKQLKDANEQLRNELGTVQTNYQSIGSQLEQIMQRLPALEAAARDARKLEAMSEHPELLSNKALRKLALKADIPDDEFGPLISELAGTVKQPVVEKKEPAAETPPSEPSKEVRTPPPNDSGFGQVQTKEALNELLYAAVRKGDRAEIDRLTDQLIALDD
jgi:chromosome segregation ATPase